MSLKIKSLVFALVCVFSASVWAKDTDRDGKKNNQVQFMPGDSVVADEVIYLKGGGVIRLGEKLSIVDNEPETGADKVTLRRHRSNKNIIIDKTDLYKKMKVIRYTPPAIEPVVKRKATPLSPGPGDGHGEAAPEPEGPQEAYVE